MNKLSRSAVRKDASREALRGPKFFFQNFPLEGGLQKYSLDLSTSHYIRSVLRARIDDKILLVHSKAESIGQARIVNLEKHVDVLIESIETAPAQSCGLDTIIIGVLKTKKNDFIVEKCSELSVRNIFFFQAEHSVSIKDTRSKQFETELTERAKEACQQCGRFRLPNVRYFQNLHDLNKELEQPPNASCHKIFCSMEEKVRHPGEIFLPSSSITAAIGPEGDFSSQEKEFLQTAGFQAITLGPQRLRSETAAVAVATLGLLSLF